MDKLFDKLEKFIVKKQHHRFLTKGKQYLLVHVRDNKIMTLCFTGKYKSYCEGYSGPYGDSFEGYCFNSLNKSIDFDNNVISKKTHVNDDVFFAGYYKGYYTFDFYELIDSFRIDSFYDILKNNFLFDFNYNKNLPFDSYETYLTKNIHIYKTNELVLCGTTIEIDDDDEYIKNIKHDNTNNTLNNVEYYWISFNETLFEHGGTFFVTDSDKHKSYDEIFKMEKFVLKLTEN